MLDATILNYQVLDNFGGSPMGRVAVVTGGGSGIGLAVCHRLAVQGHAVAVFDIDDASAGRVASELEQSGTKSLACRVDVADPASISAGFEEVRSVLGPVEILVTSAGVAPFESFAKITLESWNRVIAVNLTGTFLCAQQALPDMVAAGWGRIVTISSSSAQTGAPRMGHYSASKGGVIALTRSLSREYGRHGITVNTIPPSSILTPMAESAQRDGNLLSTEEMAARIPVGRMGTADDIAAATAFLCSEDASYISGQVVGVNGASVIT